MSMVVVNPALRRIQEGKIILCSSCKKGRLASIPARGKLICSARGTIPDKVSIILKCPICASYIPLTVE